MSQGSGQARWQAVWRERGWQARLLWPLSKLYAGLSALRRALYARNLLTVERLPVPVIVIGNVVVGGAGKTPTVLAVLQHLKARGWRPGVVSRGHGRQTQGVLEVRMGTAAADGGDEPVLIRQVSGAPVFVGERRVEAARSLLQAHPETNLIVCDDGLQHLALGRDLSIAVFDDRGVGNGWLLPAGLLREPWPPSPDHPFPPDLVLIQSSNGAPSAGSSAFTDQASVFRASRRLSDRLIGPHNEQMAWTDLVGQPLTAVAGIARPEAFFDMLRGLGLTVKHTIALSDHADAAQYAPLLTSVDGILLCTEKDAVKLFPLCWSSTAAHGLTTVWAVPLELQAEANFWHALDQQLKHLTQSA